jgi:hypothetical protein
LGWFLPFGFIKNGHNLGWALARLYKKQNMLVGVLLDLHYSDVGAQYLNGMVRRIVGTLCGMGADLIVSTTTCPLIGNSLRRNRFLHRATLPALLWPGAHRTPDEPVRLSLLLGDGGFRPLPTAAEYSTLVCITPPDN